MKLLLQRLFGVGRVPPRMRSRFKAEGIVLSDEGIDGTLVLEDYTESGEPPASSSTSFTGAIFVTEKRFAGFVASKDLINLALDDAKMKKVRVSNEGENVLLIAFDASDLNPEHAGKVEARWWTPQARLFWARIFPLTT